MTFRPVQIGFQDLFLFLSIFVFWFFFEFFTQTKNIAKINICLPIFPRNTIDQSSQVKMFNNVIIRQLNSFFNI